MNTADLLAITTDELAITRLGERHVDTPLAELLGDRQETMHYVTETDRVLLDDTLGMAKRRGGDVAGQPAFNPGGPRAKLYFEPSQVTAGIVTCGGLCPGLNNVIRGLVLQLGRAYGVKRVLGFRNGYKGLTDGSEPMVLTEEVVADIHTRGGTILGTSRGNTDPAEQIDTLVRHGVDVLFVIGGDGSLRGAQKLANEALERGLDIGVVGIPKTIDNDIPWIDSSFGFQTAFAQAADAISAAYTEAFSTEGGVGVVKLMGRHSGFIASYATLANHNVDFTLIPEVPFSLDGFLAQLQQRVKAQGHAVVVVAEGAGQELFPAGDRDRPVRQRAPGRHRRPAVPQHRRALRLHAADAALRRPRVRDPLRRGELLRRGLLHAPGAGGGARRYGRLHLDGGGPVARPVRAPADRAGHREPQQGRPARRPVDVGPGGHGAAQALLTPAGAFRDLSRGGRPLAGARRGGEAVRPRPGGAHGRDVPRGAGTGRGGRRRQRVGEVDAAADPGRGLASDVGAPGGVRDRRVRAGPFSVGLAPVGRGLPAAHGRIRGLDRSAAVARAGELLERLDLVGAEAGVRTPLRALSKGNAQKVAVAQAVLVAPEVLILDEPWSGLDASAHGVLDAMLREAAAAGAAVVVTDHREQVAGAVVWRLRDGRLVRGPVAEPYDDDGGPGPTFREIAEKRGWSVSGLGSGGPQ